MRADEGWVETLTIEESDEIVAAVAHLTRTGVGIGELTRRNFDIPFLATRVASWSRTLRDGRGFVLVRGMPVESASSHEIELAFYGLGLHLGTPVKQNNDGDLLGHVRDTGDDPNDPAVRRYKTRVAQPFHTDGSDCVGLLCMKPAAIGGESTIVSSWSVYNAMLERRPDLAPLWFEPFSLDLYEQQAPGEKGWFDASIGNVVGDQLFTFYLRFYITQAQRHSQVQRLSDTRVEFLDLLDALCDELRLDMDFLPGDIQWLANSSIFHGRTEYEDFADPTQKRHLLRLWLSDTNH